MSEPLWQTLPSTQTTDDVRQEAMRRVRWDHDRGLISDSEFDRRSGEIALSPDPSSLLHDPAGADQSVVPVTGQVGRGRAAAAHFLSLPTWVIGPGVIMAISPAGSFAGAEAWAALRNALWMTAIVAGIAVVLGEGGTGEILAPLWALAWVVMSLANGFRTAAGMPSWPPSMGKGPDGR